MPPAATRHDAGIRHVTTFMPDDAAEVAGRRAVGAVGGRAARDRRPWLASAASAGRADASTRSTCRGLSGVTLYEPEELVLSAQAGTPLAEIEALLAEHGQELAFEPMDYGPLLGGSAAGRRGTIGGVLAANLSGPRR